MYNKLDSSVYDGCKVDTCDYAWYEIAVMLTAYNFHHLLERNNQWVCINTKQTLQNLLVKVYIGFICRISDSRAETKGGVAYSHVVPRPLIPLMRKAAPTH